MTKTAYIFPGQGSQKVGMMQDLGSLPEVEAKLKQADEILGWSVMEVSNSDEETLGRTIYTQPCLYVLEAILADSQDEQPNFVAGHSLGEYGALYAAGVFDFSTGLQLVKYRAELMEKSEGGKMAALIGFDRQQLTTALDQTPNVVLANDNSDAQVVISGTPEGVDAIIATVKTKRAVPLNVSGAFHSPLMVSASEQFKTYLDGVTFNPAKIPVLSNVDPVPSTDPDVLKTRLSQQMTGSVRWREIMMKMAEEGITKAIEVGPGQVLTNLLKRAFPEIERVNLM